MNKFLIVIIVLVILGGGYWWWSQDAALPSTNSGEGAPPGSIHNLPVPPAVAAVKARVATDAGVAEDRVVIMTAYERDWSDSCLGLGGPAESCLQAITSGYEVTAEAAGKTYIYRTNSDGTVLRQQT